MYLVCELRIEKAYKKQEEKIAYAEDESKDQAVGNEK